MRRSSSQEIGRFGVLVDLLPLEIGNRLVSGSVKHEDRRRPWPAKKRPLPKVVSVPSMITAASTRGSRQHVFSVQANTVMAPSECPQCRNPVRIDHAREQVAGLRGEGQDLGEHEGHVTRLVDEVLRRVSAGRGEVREGKVGATTTNPFSTHCWSKGS